MIEDNQVERHIKTHTERSADDISAVSILESFLRSDGKINTNFSCCDKWPNTDGTFEFVPHPDISRRPEQNYFVQIKGTHIYSESEGKLKYSLKSLAFPAFIYAEITADPGILFVVLDADRRGSERVFYKYMSIGFLQSIDFSKDSVTITFSAEEEIKNTIGSITSFCEKLQDISEHHLFTSKLDNRQYEITDTEKIIRCCCDEISESIERLDLYNDTRDNISKRILRQLNDLCSAALLLNSIQNGCKKASLSLAWEQSLLDRDTKYLGSFLKGVMYIGHKVPDEGQSERLMLKYYDFLWQIRQFVKKTLKISVLANLEKFPHETDDFDEPYYSSVAKAIESVDKQGPTFSPRRYFVQKKSPFYIGKERYYEVTLQLSGIYATKYNRITIYTKENISTNYSIQVSYQEKNIDLLNIVSYIKVVTAWRVSIDPRCLNLLAISLRKDTKIRGCSKSPEKKQSQCLQK